jgi:hypothetical protein
MNTIAVAATEQGSVIYADTGRCSIVWRVHSNDELARCGHPVYELTTRLLQLPLKVRILRML